MDFILWAARSLHLFSVVVWFGGLMYQAAVTFPVAKAEQSEFSPLVLHLMRRFLPFIWMSACTVLVTGLCMMLFSPRFVFFAFHDRWSMVLAGKELVFVLMMVFSLGYARMFRRVDAMVAGKDGTQMPSAVAPFVERMHQFARINVALAIVLLLLASSMS